ncbi:16S rRNA processing protein RimM [Gordonia bronchialis DSM 43247]|jgi:16S rRNA processing protein RimM|uniref:Ribosome maturation factor RimM n=1 Tax=Gordonia bronchialis (strain ATCC 25592 / DSM 43247 / BCRC 13721 / JCM 3198 / KCTC 3076 / NBRC 16047 / NCTC 10667) TaxID=526226 RepID=D0LAM4_GORB4|nr:ribosome maturation factor RimM [Gordonia bronchialis]ACY21337.1 16S rRNA processing protein RimM [Gordonia bronchialis DSM 43247]MCC3324121.1 ribosome maturation factor RimM [Gordonia bronchialis]QGS24989.1 ribosome maturation factor RimM [Gordonia bronchialis]UAK38735.1 ribosome maturation factor RimM [Gordonia bronchialis]STQ64211.1 Ribosome maturation factor rimM [Gordonia bronchialis]
MDLVVGRVAKSHGVRGEVVVDIRTDDPETRFAVGTVLRGRMPKGAGDREFTVTAARHHAGRLLLSLAEVTDRGAADGLRGVLFLIDSSEAQPSDDPDEFYDHELEGVPVSTVDGVSVGVVESVLHLPGGELLSVRTEDRREVLVPFVRQIVPTVTREQIVIDPPDGLLDEAQ